MQHAMSAPQDLDSLRAKAEAGDVGAQNSLGDHYTFGRGVEQDFEEGRRWYEKAAERGFAEAQDNLGRCYQFGRGVKRDFGEAYKWFLRAACQDHLPSMRNVCGIFREVGTHSDGVVKDFFDRALRPENLRSGKDKTVLNT